MCKFQEKLNFWRDRWTERKNGQKLWLGVQ